MKTKIIYSNDGVLTDLTTQLNDYNASSQAFTFVAAEDSILVGSIYPFTSKYFRQTSVNSSASTLTVSYWDGVTWRAMSDQTDESGLAGTPFTNSGYISTVTDKRYPWTADDTVSNGTEQITGFGTGLTLYNLYWVKLTYSANIAMTLNWIGDVFCTDTDLGAISPSVLVPGFMDDWESGKTDWEDQRVSATRLLIEEMKGVNLNSEDILLDKDELTSVASFRTLALIYGEMQDMEKHQMYMDRVEVLLRQSFSKDTNLNGKSEPNEVGIKQPTFVR